MYNFFQTSVEFLKGVGPQRAEILRKELGIATYYDLLTYYPFRYVDKSNYQPIQKIDNEQTFVLLRGRIIHKEIKGQGAKSRLSVILADDSGEIALVWFRGIKWIKDKLEVGKWYVVFGKPTLFRNEYNISHPEIEPYTEESQVAKETLYPLYNTTESMKNKGLNSKTLSKIVKTLLVQADKSIPEIMPDEVVSAYRLMPREESFKQIHFPVNQETLHLAERRLKFEELFFLQLKILMEKRRTHQTKGYVFEHVGKYFNDFYNHNLPFSLTGAQQRVMKEIRTDLRSGVQMNRLLQGDVGSGKTLVALMNMLICADNGFQSCMMAPTEILANQHFNSIQKFISGLGLKVALLTGSTKTQERKKINEALLSGELHLIVGTHALIEDTVNFQNLGLVIIDEQHRFGVAQRAKLWSKSDTPPHILVMTATPIPRTLAMTLYGDLDVSIIDELPPGRKPVTTIHRYDNARASLFAFMKDQIAKGRQIYVVYPLINESEKLDLKDLMDGWESISRAFPKPQYQISIVHGKMKAVDKDFEMERFIKNQTQIMVSTTVIEVGVDVPNASVMVIENAERFGLSQLHQLRGRVGRGAEQSYCVLMTKEHLTGDARQRIQTMVKTNDGFEIAEVDLTLRGPGDIQGTKQSGVLNLKIADLVKDEKMIYAARDIVTAILKEDPHLEDPKYKRLKEYSDQNRSKIFWSKIS